MNIERTMLVDISHFSYRWFGTKLPPDRLTQQVIENIDSFQHSLAADRTIIIKDFKGSKFRKSLYPEYKGNRKPKDKEQEEKMRKHFANFGYVHKVLKVTYPVLEQEGVEADDIIAALCKLLPEKKVILSGDQDLMQLEVPQFSSTKSAFISFKEQDFENREQFVLAKACAGDTSDNIKGLERIGMKTALKIFKKYGIHTFEDLVNIPSPSKSKLEQRINEGHELIKFNLDLVDLYKHNKTIVDHDKVLQDLEESEGWI